MIEANTKPELHRIKLEHLKVEESVGFGRFAEALKCRIGGAQDDEESERDTKHSSTKHSSLVLKKFHNVKGCVYERMVAKEIAVLQECQNEPGLMQAAVAVAEEGEPVSEVHIVLELAKFGTIKDLGVNRFMKMPLLTLTHLIVRMFESLERFHGLGFIHCYIGPANSFLFDAELEDVRLGDFGLSLPLQFNGIPIRRGTPKYMGSEVKQRRVLSQASDVFSCAAVATELLRYLAIGQPAIAHHGVVFRWLSTLLRNGAMHENPHFRSSGRDVVHCLKKEASSKIQGSCNKDDDHVYYCERLFYCDNKTRTEGFSIVSSLAIRCVFEISADIRQNT